MSSEEITCVETPASVDGVVDQHYLGANPDVRQTGMTAREHYERHGRAAGRVQWTNVEAVDRLRQAKLDRLRFRRASVSPRRQGHALSFITPSMVVEFGLPEHPPVSANRYASTLMDEIRASPELLYLDVGAGLRYSCLSNVVNTEIYDSVSTDVVCLAEDLPFESEQFDYVICAAVLEHTRRPWQAAQEIIRVLKPGGRMLIDWPFLQAVHGYPHHYFNATPQGVISMFEQSCDITSSTVNSNQHPIFTLYWFLAIWRAGLPAATAADFDRMTVADFLASMPDQQMGHVFCSQLPPETQHLIAAGSTLLARKREQGGVSHTPGLLRRIRSRLAGIIDPD